MFAGSRRAYRPWNNASASRSAKERIIRPVYIRMPFRSPSVHIERADLARMASSTAVGKRGERGWPAGCERAMLERARALIPPLPERAPAAAAIDVATPLLHVGREASTAAVSSGRNITEAEALRARLDMVYAQHQVGWALERPCEMDGARWVRNPSNAANRWF